MNIYPPETRTMNEAQDLDLGDDLAITRVERQKHGGTGTWVQGTLAGHRFDALVFPEHAENPDWELGDSRISTLWIKRLADNQTVFNWDRGADVPAADDLAGAVVDFLAGGLAEHIFSR
jgi:hypothetical protein